jgi:methionine-rich copper-binding protein CopC
MRRVSAVALGAVALLTCLVGPAFGHGEQQTTTPADGARVSKVPGKVRVGLTEPPGPGSTLKAFDGCNNRVAGPVAMAGDDLTLTPEGGEPGRWHVEWSSISSVDGHPTKGHFVFRVAGTKDCSPDEPEDDGDEIGGGATTRVSGSPPEDEGGGFPVVPFAAGTVVVVGLAFILRRASGSN